MDIQLQSHARSDQPMGVGGKIFLTLFLLIFGGMGTAFFVFMLGEVQHMAASYFWASNSCSIESARITEDQSQDNPYTVDVRYTYFADGRQYTSTIVSTSDSSYDDYSDAQRQLNRFPVGGTVDCYVNRKNASNSILERQSPWTALMLLFPLPFMLIGFGGIYAVWFLKGKRLSTRNGSTSSISQQATREGQKGGRVVGIIFFSIFFLVGLLVGHFFFLQPLMKSFGSGDWLRAQAIVEHSRVKSHSSDDGTTYSIDILYSYQVNGIRYKSNQYSFFGGSSSGYDSKKDIVRQYPRGKEFFCWVNPSDPTEAVIERSLGWELLFGLIPLVFLLVGGGGLYAMIKGGRKTGSEDAQWRHFETSAESPPHSSTLQAGSRFAGSTSSASAEMSWLPSLEKRAEFTSGGEYLLKPGVSAKTKLIIVLIIAAFWNGIVSIPISQVIDSWSSGSPDWFLTLFMIPFALVGLGLLVGVFYLVLALFNAKPQLRLSSLYFRPGERVSLHWELLGRASAVRDVVLTIEGKEVASYTRGTSTYTDKHTFYKKEVARISGRVGSRGGNVSFNLPLNAIHSFEASNNKIIWSLEFHGVIDRWPDIKEDWQIGVLPEGRS